jgi:hypothetical protein
MSAGFEKKSRGTSTAVGREFMLFQTENGKVVQGTSLGHSQIAGFLGICGIKLSLEEPRK